MRISTSSLVVIVALALVMLTGSSTSAFDELDAPRSGCNCTDNFAYCGTTSNQGCTGLDANSLYVCVTRGHAPLLSMACPHGCQSVPGADATCIPEDTTCTCPDAADHCGASLQNQAGKNCKELAPSSLYSCSKAGAFPQLRWACPDSCVVQGANLNDTCSRGAVNNIGLTKVKHIVILMQENRAFDHYYGTMAGVCNYADPNPMVQSNGLNIFFQPDPNSPDKINGVNMTMPWQITGPKAGCTSGGSNAWDPNHAGWNNGLMNNWPEGNTVASLGYLTRTQLPFYFELAEQFTIADMYFQSIMTSTNPNRLVLWTGSIDPRAETPRGPSIDNTEIPPFEWFTYPEVLENAGISWMVWQGSDNFDDNALEWFVQYSNASSDSPLFIKGISNFGIDGFIQAALNGTLPQVSWVVGPTELSEHPDNGPLPGEWFVQQIVNALINSSNWENTVLIVDYDESGGFIDHVAPPIAPYGTLDEWINTSEGPQPIGPGLRVPSFIVSPWHTGGNVFTEVTDHTSVIQFVEQWAIANGYPAEEVLHPLISTYRRNFFSDYTHSFDWSRTNLSAPYTTPIPEPSKNSEGYWNPTEMCEAIPGAYPSVPYGNQSYPVIEKGYKKVMGNNPGNGRTYVLQSGNNAVTQTGSSIAFAPVPADKTQATQFFTMTRSTTALGYNIISNNGQCLSGASTLTTCSATSDTWYVLDTMNSEGYVLQNIPTGLYLTFSGSSFSLVADISATFTIYSVVPPTAYAL
eukprot:gene13833-16310_t